MIYKKTLPNALITLYLGSREIVSKRGEIEPLRGVLFVNPKYVIGHRLFSQLTLTFRYGREDEEVMGLKFCNEAVIALKQIWPRTEETNKDSLTPLQQALLQRLGVGAHAFSIVGIVASRSVQLIPAKQYSGAPIGTSYDIRAFIADHADEKLQRRSTVKLGVRLIHKIPPEIRCCPSQTISFVSSSLSKCLRIKLSPKALKFSNKLCGNSANNKAAQFEENHDTDEESCQAAQGFVEQPFLWTDDKVSLKAALNETAYDHDEDVTVTVEVRNNSRKVIRKIRKRENPKFRRIWRTISGLSKSINLRPTRTPTKNWIAVEGVLFNSSTETHNWNENTRLAPSSPQELKSAEDRNAFAIYVSYYVKVKLTLSGMGGEVSLKFPFILGHVDNGCEEDDLPAAHRAINSSPSVSNSNCPVAASDISNKSNGDLQGKKCEVIKEISELNLSNTNLIEESTTKGENDSNNIQVKSDEKNPSEGDENEVENGENINNKITVLVHVTSSQQSLLTDVN